MDCKSVLPKFTKGISPFVYEGEAARAVNRLKNGRQRLAAYFGEQMCARFLCDREEATSYLLVAVPATAESLLRRGYNQAERLAEGVYEYLIAHGVAVEMDFAVLEKRRETQPQKRLSRRERAENVKGAFHVRKRSACKGKVILLVDDICTTGATGSEIAERLFGAGAKKVYFLTATAVPEQK